MKVLVINAGSSSLKYQLIEMDNEQVICKGNCERIGAGGFITHSVTGGAKIEKKMDFPTHKEAFLEVVSQMTSGEGKVIDDMSEIVAVGHRVLHGSEIYKQSTLVTDEVIDTIYDLRELGPLHNPPQAIAMRACREVFGPNVPMVAVFDTSFHQTMPPKSYIFPIPYEYYEKYSIRRYGFHGTSHRYVSKRFFELTGRDPEGSRIITCHLGNGSSLCAIMDGKCFDTSMGLTPLDGFIMGTRSGGVDPSAIIYLQQKEGWTPSDTDTILNKKSGAFGISGVSSDDRDLIAAGNAGNHRALLARKMQHYQIRKFIGSYVAAMDGVDAIVFTGGVGENAFDMRANVCNNLSFLGIAIDEAYNSTLVKGKEGEISTPESKVRVFVLPTNEELVIARDTKEIYESLKK